MPDTTLIEWANSSFAPWFGCTKVGPECDNCYAENWTALRFHKAEWGHHADRVRSAQSTWTRCLSQDRKAAKDGVRRRIFCSELSDVFDNKAPDEWRHDLWALIRQCRNLDWLILTKRIQNVPKMAPHDWPLPNVWLGVTAGTQVGWDRDVVLLRKTRQQSALSASSQCSSRSAQISPASIG
jgi:protein gp37